MSALAQSLSPAAGDTAALRAIGVALATPREQIESTFVTVGARLTEGAAMLNIEALPQRPEGGGPAQMPFANACRRVAFRLQ